MKQIRQITDVVTTSIENEGDENNNENKASLVTIFDSEAGYYQLVIRPMLMPGHENEFIYWLKSFGLIVNEQICSSPNESCLNKTMNWEPERRGSDLYHWKCNICSCKKSIRENSIFESVKCNFKNAVRILLGWCKGNDHEYMANMLGVKRAVVGNLYNTSSAAAEKYMRSHLSEWQLGGPGVVVLVDIFPEGCTNTAGTQNRNRPILCISEAKSLPQKYWLEALERRNRNINDIKQRILNVIQDIVLPGSILVAPSTSSLCSYFDLQSLKAIYPTIVSTRGLERHDNNETTVLSSLEVIWRRALDICNEAQFYNYQHVQQFLISEMWRLRFGRDSFEMLLYQLSMSQ